MNAPEPSNASDAPSPELWCRMSMTFKDVPREGFAVTAIGTLDNGLTVEVSLTDEEVAAAAGDVVPRRRGDYVELGARP